MQGVLTAKKENAKQFVEASEIIVNLISTCFQVECNKPDSANLPDMNFQIIDKNFSLGIPQKI